MNEVTKVFEGMQLRIIQGQNGMLFLLKDVCEILELGQASAVKRRLEDDVITNHPIQDSLGRTQMASFVNEDGLYDVILDSRKPEAKQFRKWITSEVLPSIRKTGGYETQPMSQLEIMQMQIAKMVEQEKQLNQLETRTSAIEQKQNDITEILSLNPTEWKKKVNGIVNAIAKSRGGFQVNYADVRNESYQHLEDRAKCRLSIRLTNKKSEMALNGASKSKIDKVSKMDVIADDSRLTEIYLAIVKELAIKYGVNLEVSA